MYSRKIAAKAVLNFLKALDVEPENPEIPLSAWQWRSMRTRTAG
ncbi:MAG: hypothetical protein U5N56_05400 [Candidatus Marinimicrobia bacterium]|nr:hypothetical protein [Candidatus Neomarinimicrobiota bacterium]